VLSQSVSECKERFSKYLSLKGALSGNVIFESNAIYILNESGEKEFSVYQDEIPVLADFFQNSTHQSQLRLYKQKGLKHFTKKQLDSLYLSADDDAKLPPKRGSKPLQGIRIALDPGHFSSNITDSKVEGKFLNFVKDESDTIKLVEGQLTFLTAQILKAMLEEQGAKVYLSRTAPNTTAFNLTYVQWYNTRRIKVLDSLCRINEIDENKCKALKQMTKEKFFWTFFRDYELMARSQRINSIYPHLSVIIHYNVDEKNSPWKQPSDRNLTMCFIGGGFGPNDLKKIGNRVHFIRLLLGNQIPKSESLGNLTVSAFAKNLQVKKAKITDAQYLTNAGVSTPHDGVFCRNLILTRCINSPLVYGESQFQDNVIECSALNKNNYNAYGVKAPERVYTVARSYYEAVLTYFETAK
jgi:N-acetylmuramoyl-L-alanine amidase